MNEEEKRRENYLPDRSIVTFGKQCNLELGFPKSLVIELFVGFGHYDAAKTPVFECVCEFGRKIYYVFLFSSSLLASSSFSSDSLFLRFFLNRIISFFFLFENNLSIR